MEASPITVKSEFAVPVTNVKAERTKVHAKYYKQLYRTEWESMPDFKGWLKGIPGEPTRAYCTVCKKSLHAHRLSLLKHTCTLRHTKAAQKSFALQSQDPVDDPKESTEGTSEEDVTDPKVTEVEIVEDIVIQDGKENENEEEDPKENDTELSASPEEVEETPAVPVKKTPTRVEMTSPQPPAGGPLSTHVLDTAKGNPVAGLQVSLYKLIDGRWTPISEGLTNPDGRYNSFVQRADFTAGRYKLHFDVDRYFELRKLESLYPFIEIVFDVKSPQDHYHVPLLLSPFGYTTYRGS